MKIIIMLVIILIMFPSILMAGKIMDKEDYDHYKQVIEYKNKARDGEIDKYQIAINDCEKWMREYPERLLYPELLINLYLDYYKALKTIEGIKRPEYLEKAESLIERIAKKEPQQAINFQVLGKIYYEEGEIQKAQAINSKLKTYLPEDDFLDIIINYDKRKKQMEEERKHLEENKESFKQSQNMIQKKIENHIEEVKLAFPQEKISGWKNEIQNQPGAITPRLQLARYYIFIEDLNNAQHFYKEVLKIDPGNNEALKNLELLLKIKNLNNSKKKETN